jgi:hypothetical protein
MNLFRKYFSITHSIYLRGQNLSHWSLVPDLPPICFSSQLIAYFGADKQYFKRLLKRENDI